VEVESGDLHYLSLIHNEVTGNPPPLDLTDEASVQRAVRSLIQEGIVSTAHDLSLGGISVALARMAVASNVGAKVDSNAILERSDRLDEAWFGESASQILVTCDLASQDRLESTLSDSDVTFARIGETGGGMLDFGLFALDISELRAALDRAFKRPDESGAG
jgi:phosphoribosylformylglycinamidine (FGAM) synthase-like enzyme